MQLGSIAGSCVGGWGADKLGRQRVSFMAAIVLVAGCACTGLPVVTEVGLYVVFLGRSLVGIGGGVLCTGIPLWVSEVSPATHRGFLV